MRGQRAGQAGKDGRQEESLELVDKEVHS
jgi:hypothetical protein